MSWDGFNGNSDKLSGFNAGNKTCGCASHPMALQVLAGPVIEELEQMDKRSEKELPEDSVCLTPKEMRADERCYTLRHVIKLLKGDVKK
jgi:hypothetical protein